MNLEIVLGSRNRIRALRTLFQRDGRSGRAVAAAAGMAPSACKAALEELAAAGVVLCTREGGRACHEINRTHRLVPVLARLFTEETKMADRLTATIQTHLRTLSPPPDLLCVGVSPQGDVTAAMAPLPDPEALAAAVSGALRFEFGLRWAGAVRNSGLIQPEYRLWALSARKETRTRPSTQQKALRFFGIPSASPEVGEAGEEAAGGGRW